MSFQLRYLSLVTRDVSVSFSVCWHSNINPCKIPIALFVSCFGWLQLRTRFKHPISFLSVYYTFTHQSLACFHLHTQRIKSNSVLFYNEKFNCFEFFKFKTVQFDRNDWMFDYFFKIIKGIAKRQWINFRLYNFRRFYIFVTHKMLRLNDCEDYNRCGRFEY